MDIHFKNKQLMNMKYVKDLKGKNIFNNILRINNYIGILNIKKSKYNYDAKGTRNWATEKQNFK